MKTQITGNNVYFLLPVPSVWLAIYITTNLEGQKVNKIMLYIKQSLSLGSAHGRQAGIWGQGGKRRYEVTYLLLSNTS